MPADVIEQLRTLRDVLDAHAAPVTVDDLRRSDLAIQLEPQSGDVIQAGSVDNAGPGTRWTKRVLAAAAVLAVVVGLAFVGREDRDTIGPGAEDDISSTVGSPDPSTGLTADELAAFDIPVGSTLRVTKELPGAGVAWVYDTIDRSKVCLGVRFHDGAGSGGCTDAGVVSNGLNFLHRYQSHSEPALLVGIAPTAIGFSVTVNGQIVEPDADGIWYAMVTSDLAEFTITTNKGSTVFPITRPETSPTISIPPESVPDPTNQSPTTSNDSPPSIGTTVPVANRAPIAIGDSVMLGAKPQLERAGFVVDAAEARQPSDVIELVRRLRTEGRLGNIVVIHVGTNGQVTTDDLAAIMNNLPPEEVASVWFLTVTGDKPWIAANNQRIIALPSRYPNVEVGYWNDLSATLPGIATDGIHLASDEAKQTYADLIATWTAITP